MNKKIIVWICLLSMLATLSGCNKTQDRKEDKYKESIPGSYMEVMNLKPELGPNEIGLGLTKNNKNQLEYYTVQSTEDYLNSTYSCYTLVDESFQKSSIDWINKAASEFSFDQVQYCHGQDGVDYIMYRKPLTFSAEGEPEFDKVEYGVLRNVKGTNDYVDVTPADWIPGIQIFHLEVIQDGVLCYIEGIDLEFYDPVKKEKVDYGKFNNLSEYVLQGDILYYIDRIKNEIQIVQFGEKKVEKIVLESKSLINYLQVSPKGDIILLNEEGIHKYIKGGTMWETILDGKNASMSSTNHTIIGFTLLPGTFDTYYILYLNWTELENQILTSCKFVEHANDLPKRELTIYSVQENLSLDQAIFTYTKLHPDVRINLVEAISIQDLPYPQKQAESIRTFNTEILTGNGADIILMDELPMSSYIEKGVLMDMSECFSDLQEENNLLLTVTKNYTQDGKIYCMPMRIYMPICFMGEDISEDTKSIEDLAAYCLNSERNLMDPLGYDYLVRMFLYTYGNEIFTENGVFLQENLSSFLSSINEIAKKTGATEDGSRGQSYLGYPIGQSTLRMKKSLCGDLGSVYFNDVLCAISFIGDYKDLNRVCTFKNMVDGRYVPLNDIFIPNGIVGINKNSKDTELAKDFVKYLFSEEVQLQHLGDGFPINDKALTAWSQEPYDKDPVLDGATTITKNGEEKLITIEPATVEEKRQVIDEVRTLTIPVSIDTACRDIILNGTIEYLKGEKTLEQATSEISQKVNLYLSE